MPASNDGDDGSITDPKLLVYNVAEPSNAFCLGFISDHVNQLSNGTTGGLADLHAMLSGGVFASRVINITQGGFQGYHVKGKQDGYNLGMAYTNDLVLKGCFSDEVEGTICPLPQQQQLPIPPSHVGLLATLQGGYIIGGDAFPPLIMSFVKIPSQPEADKLSPNSAWPVRPHFNSQLTADRLREGSNLQSPPFKMGGNIRKGRMSVFKELGLDDDLDYTAASSPNSVGDDDEREFGEITGLRSGIKSNDEQEGHRQDEHGDGKEDGSPEQYPSRQRQNSLPSRWYAKLSNSKGRPRIKSTSGAPPGTVSGIQRLTLLALLIAVVIPAFNCRSGRSNLDLNGVDAGLVRRENSPTDVCTRWAHQAALLNGTLYIYGGQAKTEAGQVNNTWNNNFLTLDLTKNWDIDSPTLKGLTKPDGPPPVSMGYLWHDYKNLYLYGGQFSSAPYVDPEAESLWRYSISDSKWTEFSDPTTSAGNYSEPADVRVHRAAEGAGISVPELGLSWYFGGHLDWATTPGWSRTVDRVYLKSLLEFTHPGYVNSGVDDLIATGAGEGGAFRNITTGGVQANDFSERADGALVFVPGWGELGVLIGLAGGTADTFTHDLSSLDVYDIANSKWFHQETSGDAPGVRVNPCVVIASAPDASSFQIYLFGGQNLQPAGDQIQYDDMYILTIPSFTWIKVDQDKQKVPPARAGHTCSMYDGQMIVVGGYVGDSVPCDPGFYVFDATSLTWKDKFEAGDHDADFHADNAVLAGSYGYSVPKAVQDVVGGSQDGGATATTPAAGPATGGPFATGKAPIFTITQGATATASSPVFSAP
ncbi:hypothetical protein G7046_g3794 [Stylonectria norvegica]|nr:hypothetical protein G7046_g3794 [Stylonectria norvegica]